MSYQKEIIGIVETILAGLGFPEKQHNISAPEFHQRARLVTIISIHHGHHGAYRRSRHSH
jgi:hypothetical protein